jgi:DNA-binding beta-propeller fold protein YncE
MKHLLIGFAVLVQLLSVTAEATAGQILYATSLTGQQIVKVDTATNQVIPVFNTVGEPDSLVFDTHGNIIYTSLNKGQVRLFNPSTQVDTLLGGGLAGPADLALTPSGDSVLVSEANGGKIFKIDLATHKGSQLGSYGGVPQGLAFDAVGHLFAVLGFRSAKADSFIAQLDPMTGAILNQSTKEIALDGLTYDPFSKMLYSGSTEGSGIYQFDPASLNVTLLANSTKVPFDGLTTDSAGNLYLAHFDFSVPPGYIYQYNLATSTLTQLTPVSGLDDLAPVTGLGSPPVPEPTGLTLFGVSAAGLIGYFWRRRRKAGSLTPRHFSS